eukprot:scaffold330437_cov19-Prasinocladus_malaysianus.AAC.1
MPMHEAGLTGEKNHKERAQLARDRARNTGGQGEAHLAVASLLGCTVNDGEEWLLACDCLCMQKRCVSELIPVVDCTLKP